jgi:OmpA-OmpF porin, OOP family
MRSNQLVWVVLLLGWMAGSTWWHVCHIKQLCDGDAPALTAAVPPVALPDTAAVTTPAANSVTAPATPTVEQKLAEKEVFTSVFKPIDLYFPSGKTEFIRTAETEKFFAEAAKYLPRHTDKSLTLTGYTDNVGSTALNLRLSRERAESVRQQMERAGVAAGQLQVLGKGKANPKATNATDAGQRANRRVTVVVN